MSQKSNSRAQVDRVIRYFLNDKIDTSSFCSEYETEYNLNMDQSVLTASEKEIYDNLLNTVIWYSPFPDDRDKIPNYVDEDAVRTAVSIAAEYLDIK